MISNSFVTLALVLATSLGSPAFGDMWYVTAIRQPATIAVGSGSWQPLELGENVPDGSWVSTIGRGRLTLERNRDVIQIRPGSVASISLPRAGDPRTSVIRQKFGTLLFDVETRSGRSFRVETPFLAAVVKGTRFEIFVARDSASLKVEEGRVQAIDIVAGLSAIITQGQTAVLDATTPESLVVSGPGTAAALVQVAPGVPVIAPAISRAEVLGEVPAPLTDPSPEPVPAPVTSGSNLRDDAAPSTVPTGESVPGEDPGRPADPSPEPAQTPAERDVGGETASPIAPTEEGVPGEDPGRPADPSPEPAQTPAEPDVGGETASPTAPTEESVPEEESVPPTDPSSETAPSPATPDQDVDDGAAPPADSAPNPGDGDPSEPSEPTDPEDPDP